MKLVCAKYGIQFDFKENQTAVLVIENPTCMSEVVLNLRLQCEGEEGIFLLTDDDKNRKIDRDMLMILDPFSINFHERKIVSKLYDEMASYGNDFAIEKGMLNSQIVTLLDQVVLECPYSNLTYDMELDWSDLFRLYNLRFEFLSNNLLERIVEYIKIVTKLFSIRIICLVNIKTFLTLNEILELYRIAFYCKVHLFLIESAEREWIESEKTIIIDKDLCLIEK